MEKIRNFCLLGFLAIIGLCAFYWRTDLFIEALPGALILAIIHFLLFYFNPRKPLNPQKPSGQRVDYIITLLLCIFIALSVAIGIDGPERGQLWLMGRENYGLNLLLPKGLESGTFLARLDIVETLVVFVIACLHGFIYFGVTKAYPSFERILPVFIFGTIACYTELLFAFFETWMNVFNHYEFNITTLFPQTNTFFGKMVLLAMVITAVLIVAVADASRLMRNDVEPFLPSLPKYLIVFVAASLDLTSSACVLSIYILVAYLKNQDKTKDIKLS